jgi:meso-butanediol dehydrogenase / (S,S)-butanediol dehydrogenase / diacetyl reductase
MKVDSMARFSGRTAVVTGGGSGIGEASVRRLYFEGANVVIVDANEDNANRVADELGDPARLMVAVADVSDRDAIDTLMKRAAEKFGKLDFLANCAGITGSGTVMEVEPDAWQRVQAVNVVGTLNTCQAFARLARAKDHPASIVNITSVGGMLGVPNRAAYSASKHAVVGLTRSMAMEVGQFNIRVNAIAPGMIRTPMTTYNFEAPGGEEGIRKAHPIGRAGRPEEIAAAILFLASDDASFITGAIIPVDGGYTTGKGWS